LELLGRNRRYARLWGGETVSMLGDQVTGLALPLIAITVLHAPAWQLGVLVAASWLPYLFALPIGSLVDGAAAKRLVLVGADLLRGAALATVPLAFVLDRLTTAHLLVVAVVVGSAGVVSATAYASFFPQVVALDDVVTANSLNSTSRSVTALAGPPAAGWLLQVWTAPLALVIDCLSYLVSALTLAGLHVAEPRLSRHRPTVARDMVEGLRTLLANAWLASALWCTTIMNLASFAITAVVLLFATGTLHLSPAQIGLAQGIGAVGAVLGALSAARLSRRVGLYPVTVIGVIAFSAPFLAFAATPADASTPVKIAIYACCGFAVSGGIVLYDITINSMMVKVMPEQMRGRLVGAFSSINYGIRPVGALLGGLAAQAWGPRATILAAAVLGLAALLPLRRSPLRRARTMADVPRSTVSV
jgi:MFS family permease